MVNVQFSMKRRVVIAVAVQAVVAVGLVGATVAEAYRGTAVTLRVDRAYRGDSYGQHELSINIAGLTPPPEVGPHRRGPTTYYEVMPPRAGEQTWTLGPPLRDRPAGLHLSCLASYGPPCEGISWATSRDTVVRVGQASASGNVGADPLR